MLGKADIIIVGLQKLTGKALAKFEAKRDVWQDVLDGVREITAGKGKSYIVRVRCTTQLYSDPYSYSSSPKHHF